MLQSDAKDWETGCVQVYTGDGKGKTTAALGLALRAAGRGLPVYIGQFMKGRHYGELDSVKLLPGVELEQYGEPGWVYQGQLKPEQVEQAARGMARACAVVVSGKHRLVILDEINMAVWFGLIEVEAVLELMQQKPSATELVLTGRRADERVIEAADLVTEMKSIRHYYDTRKLGARQGIEE
jgi:cob(I)alamin adenosyltransferase